MHTLILAWGNPSRGDDALGPLLAEAIAALNLPGVVCLTDFQLQIEHALDVRDCQRLLLVDASASAAPPFEISRPQPAADPSLFSHAMSPAALLQVCADLGHPLPETWLLAIRGEQFVLGEPLSLSAQKHLAAAVDWVRDWTSPHHITKRVLT
jgi:hydrogenase maturation protease